MLSEKQTILAYLGQSALLLRRLAHKKTTTHEQAEILIGFAADIQGVIESIERQVA